MRVRRCVFKTESTALVTNTLQALRIDNFRVDGIVTAPCTPPIVDLGPDTVLCNAGTLTLDAGNTGATFEWSINDTTQIIDVTVGGTYWVTVTTGPNCSTTDTIEVLSSVTPTITPSDITIDCSANNVCTFSVVNPLPDAEYFWDFCDGNSATGSVVYYIPTTSDTCIGTVTVENVCGSDATNFILTNGSVGIKNAHLAKEINIFPNPAQNAFSIQNNTKQSLKSVTLTDMTGRVVFSQSLNNLPSEIIDVSSLQDGAYLLAIESEQGVIIKQLSLVR